MPKETKFTLALMFLLAITLGFIVWQRASKEGDVVALLKQKMNNLIGNKDADVAQNDPDQDNPPKKNEPRKLPFDPQQTAQSAVGDSDDHDHHDHHLHGKAKAPVNPFAQNSANAVARKPPQDLFAKPVSKQTAKTAPQQKSDPFSPWAQKNLGENNNIAQQKPPVNPFLQNSPVKPREEAPRPNPFATGHQLPDKSSRSAHAHTHQKQNQPVGQTLPSNLFDANSSNNPQKAGTAQLNSGSFPSKKLPDPFMSVQHANQKATQVNPPVQQTAQQAAQQPFDPFGNIPIPPAGKSQQAHQHTFDNFPPPNQSPKQHSNPAPAFNEQTHRHRHHHSHQQQGAKDPFNSPKYTPKNSNPLPMVSGPTRVYTVKPDETYWSISKKIYGSIRFFQALEEHNRSRISSAKRLRPGMKVLVPEEKILLARYSQIIPGAGKSSDSDQSEQGHQGLFFTPSGQPMFRIGEEDTLSDIAHKHLGRTTRWVEIFSLNRDRVKTPDRLKIGTVLRLPRDASRIALAPEATIRR